MKNYTLWLFIGLSALALLARLIWHVPNFSPLASLLLFTGVYASHKKYWLLPMLALLLSDLLIGFYAWPIMLSVYGALALNLLIGKLLQKNPRAINIASATLFSALSFFVITNLAVWLSGNWYAHDLSGLKQCFVLAVPFFKNTLLSNVLYSALLFTPVKVLEKIKLKRLVTNI